MFRCFMHPSVCSARAAERTLAPAIMVIAGCRVGAMMPPASRGGPATMAIDVSLSLHATMATLDRTA
jgi:hypothetical protein